MIAAVFAHQVWKYGPLLTFVRFNSYVATRTEQYEDTVSTVKETLL